MSASISRGSHRLHPLAAAAPSITSGTANLRSSRCDCAAHRTFGSGRHARPGNMSSLTLLLPLLACAFCPACLTLWAPLLASLGLGFALPEAVHPAGIGIAVLVALAPAAQRARRAKAWRPLLFVAAGAGMLLATHAVHGGRIIELLGALCLVLGSLLERRAGSVTGLTKGVAP